MRSPWARSPLWSNSLVTQARTPGTSAAVSSPKRPLDVEVLGVDRARDRHPVGAQHVLVIQPRPLDGGELVGDVARRRQRPVFLEHERQDVLAGEPLRVLVELRRAGALRGPVRDTAVGVAGLVQDRVDRVAGDAELVRRVVQERG